MSVPHSSPKIRLVEFLRQSLAAKLQEAQQSILTTQDSRDNETKSTSGDKYETGRAMVQIELQKLADQRDKIDVQAQTLARVDAQKHCTKAEFGSLVQTENEQYFLAIGLGKIMFEGVACYAISMDSPIGKVLKDKQTGDRVQFQGRALTIVAID